MKETGILMTAESVRAILDGRKTQTRRVVKSLRKAPWHQFEPVYLAHRWTVAPHPRGGFWAIDVPNAGESWMSKPPGKGAGFPCPYGQPGDRLWVRETWGHDWYDNGQDRAWKRVVYRADDPQAQPQDQGSPMPWRSPIHMPRWASRITLEITGVRVERLQGISREDAKAEGIGQRQIEQPITDYRTLWNSLNAKRGYDWESNPFVWVLEFVRVEQAEAAA